MEHESAPASVKRSSASRYWTARLQVFKRPAVWGSALLLMLPLVFLANYWRNPEGFVVNPASTPTDPLALPSDQSLPNSLNGDGATLTSPPVSDASTLLEVPALPEQRLGDGQISEPTPQPNLLDALLSSPLLGLDSKLPQPKAEPSSRNSFAIQPRSGEPSLGRALNGTGSALSSSLFSAPLFSATTAQPANPGIDSGLTSEARANQAALPLSPLQLALDRSAGIENASNPSPAGAQTEPQSNLTAQALPNAGQALPWLLPTGQYARPLGTQPLGTQTYIPQTSPFPGTTGYTLPSALRPTNSPYFSNYPVYSNYSNSYFNGANPNFGYPNRSYAGFPAGSVTPSYPTIPQLAPTLPISPYGRTPSYSTGGVPVPSFNPPAPSVIPQPVPFSIPRTPPGRYIGGGEINTFSNP